MARMGSSLAPRMEIFEVAKLGAAAKTCPKCGMRADGPYRKGEKRGFYYEHHVVEKGVRRTTWHYVSALDSPSERREKLVNLVKRQGWMGMRYFAGLLGVSEHTIRRDLDALRREGRIIHQPYGDT